MLAEPKKTVSSRRLQAVMAARDERLEALRNATARLEKRISEEPEEPEEKSAAADTTRRNGAVVVPIRK